MKAKIFEWVEAGFEIPPPLLADPAAGEAINEAIRFATDCAAIIRAIFREAFGGASKKSERHRTLNSRMQDDYWAALAAPFREFVLAMVDETQRSVMRRSWIDRIMREAKEAFKQSAALLGDDALTLRQRVRGEQRCDIFLAKKRKETLTDE